YARYETSALATRAPSGTCASAAIAPALRCAMIATTLAAAASTKSGAFSRTSEANGVVAVRRSGQTSRSRGTNGSVTAIDFDSSAHAYNAITAASLAAPGRSA